MDGKFVLKFGSKGSSNGHFNNPWGIALDELGLIYVVDKVSCLNINSVVENNNYIFFYGLKTTAFFGICGLLILKKSIPVTLKRKFLG